MNRINVAILFGGQSNEYPVSLMSSYNVLSSIDHTKYCVHMIGITKQNEWYLYTGDISSILNDTWHCNSEFVLDITLDMSSKQVLANTQVIPIDAAMIVMHGKFGEDGSLQGVLNMLGIKIIGCDLLTSAIGLNKKMSHLVAQSVGVNVANSVMLTNTMSYLVAEQSLSSMKFPLYIKPMSGGSSIGLSRIDAISQLQDALDVAFLEDDKVIVEEEISGFEVGCAIIGKNTLKIGRVDEVELDGCVFDYEQKYTQTKARIITPARISVELEDQIMQTGLKLYEALGCQGFARIDMFINDQNQIYFNEINTIPGMTKQSRFSKMFNAVGISFEEMLDLIIQSSL